MVLGKAPQKAKIGGELTKVCPITPIAGRIIALQLDIDNKTKGGLYIPNVNNLLDVRRYEVLAVGPGILKPDGTIQPMHIKAGDVIFSFRHHDINYAGVNYSVLEESNVVGIEVKPGA